jgi:hypothetical protein
MATQYKDLLDRRVSSAPVTDSISGPAGIQREYSRQTKNALEAEYKTVRENLADLNRRLLKSYEQLPTSEQDQLKIRISWENRLVSYREALLIRKRLLDRQRELQNQLNIVQTQITNQTQPAAIPRNASAASASGPLTEAALSSQVLSNAPMPKEAYFRPIQSLLENKVDQPLYAGNTPRRINDAEQQWSFIVNGFSQGSKGQIQTWKPPRNYSMVNAEGSDVVTNLAAGGLQRYAFKFLYNPETVDMVYGGVSDFDITTLTSGQTKSLPMSPNLFQSTISFTVPLNRIFDMRYVSVGGNLVGGRGVTDIYPHTVPAAELTQIYKKGTMYDFEYLLKSILGVELPTQFRGTTADIGFLYGRPVELHLGASLRYLVQISDIRINHLLFDSRMVPIFSSVSLSVKRIPDYSGEAIVADTGTGNPRASGYQGRL